MKKYKTTLTLLNMQSLVMLIQLILSNAEVKGGSEALELAAYAEIELVINKKLVEYKRSYNVSFTPVQALALTLLYNLFTCGAQTTPTEFTNRLMLMNNEILQQYSI